VVYLQWKSKAQETDDLRYIVWSGIVNTTTRAVAEHIMVSKTDEGRWPAWGDASWSMGSDEAKALLGTPNGAGVAWLLAQHKEQLGHKTIRKVHLVYNANNSLTYHGRLVPSLVFELRDTKVDTDEIAAPQQLAGGS
jgi:hypothetical protein